LTDIVKQVNMGRGDLKVVSIGPRQMFEKGAARKICSKSEREDFLVNVAHGRSRTSGCSIAKKNNTYYTEGQTAWLEDGSGA